MPRSLRDVSCEEERPSWSIALPPPDDEDESFTLLNRIASQGLVYSCEQCNRQTFGPVFHNRPGITPARIEAALSS